VTPFTLADGRVVFVNRGFVAGGATRADLPHVPVPAGEMNVRGRIAIPAKGYYELGADNDVQLQQHLDPARYAAATGVAVLPIVIEATAPVGADDGLLRDWPEPDTGVAMHRGYMVQWYTFAALALGLWVWFTFRRRRAQ
jgi:surfeit locus 1 family protein